MKVKDYIVQLQQLDQELEVVSQVFLSNNRYSSAPDPSIRKFLTHNNSLSNYEIDIDDCHHSVEMVLV